MVSAVLSGSGINKIPGSSGPIINRQSDGTSLGSYRGDYLELGELNPNFVSESYGNVDASLMQQRLSPLDMPSVVSGEVRLINNSANDFWIIFSDKERFLLKGTQYRSHHSTPHICILRRMVQAPLYDHDYGITENMGLYNALNATQQMKHSQAKCASHQTFSKIFISAAINRPVFVRNYGCVIVPTSVYSSDTYHYPDVEHESRYRLEKLLNEVRRDEAHPIIIHINDPSGLLPCHVYAWINGYYSKIRVSRDYRQAAPRISISRIDEDGKLKLESFYIGDISKSDIGRNVWAFDGIMVGATREAIQAVLNDDPAEDIVGPSNNRIVSLMSQVTDLTSTVDVHLSRIKTLEGEIKRATEALQSHSAVKQYLADRDEDARRIKREEDDAKHAREMERIRQETEHKDMLARIKAEEDARRAEDEEHRRQFEREKMQYERERMQQEKEHKEALAKQKLEEDLRKAEDEEMRRKHEREKMSHDAEHKARMEDIKLREAKVERRFKLFETVIKVGLAIATTVIAVLKFLPKKKEDSMALT